MLSKYYKKSTDKFSNSLPLSKRIHPGIKFFCFIVTIIFIFLADSFFTQLILASFIVTLYSLCHLGRKNFIMMLKSFIIIFLLFTIINWIFYKNPIAFNIDGYNHIGSWNILEKYQWAYHDDKTFVSHIFGGYIIDPKNNLDLIKRIVDDLVANHKDVVNKWIGTVNVDINKLVIPQAWGSVTEDFKKAFLYLMNNKVVFENIKYSNQMIQSLQGAGNIAYSLEHVILYVARWYSLSPVALIRAGHIAIKILCVLLTSSMLTETTTSVELSAGLETMLSPLKIIKFPVNEAATIIAVAIRFIPSLLSESKRILNAQASRGVDFSNGNLFTKIKALVSLVVPLFSIAFKNSEELANAMDARGYDPKAFRTKYRIFHFSGYDFVLLLMVSFFGSFVAAIKFMNVFFVFFGLAEGELVI